MIKKISLLLLCSFTALWAEIITVGYIASTLDNFSKKDISISAEVWLTEIAKELNMGVHSKVYDDPKEMMQDLKDEKVDYMSGFGLTFVKNFDMSLLDDGFAQGFFNGEQEYFVILVQKGSGIKNLSDLKNQAIGIQQSDEVMQLYLDLNIAKKTDAPLQIESFSTRQRVLLKLFFGKIKAAVVTNKSFELAKELNPQIADKLEILVDTKLQANSFGFLRKSLNEQTKKRFIKLSKNIHKQIRGRQLLTLYKAEIVTDSKLEDLKPFEALYKQSLQLSTKEK